jgi:hypothetical protein
VGGQSPDTTADDTAPGPIDTDAGSGGVAAAEEWNPDDFDHVYDVGPGRAYGDPGEIPWESLEPSTLVRIYYRDAPYRAKWVVTTTGNSGDTLLNCFESNQPNSVKCPPN